MRDCARVAVFALVICSDVPKTFVSGDGHKNCTPLTKIMSAHIITMTYFNFIKVGKEDTFGVSTDDDVLLGVLPCIDWKLGPRISSVTLKCSLVMGQFFISLFSTICSNFLVLALPMVCWKLRACRLPSHLSWIIISHSRRRYSLAQKHVSFCCLKHHNNTGLG